jgi:hypothetical protein
VSGQCGEIIVGNTQLKPETATTWSLGLTLTPTALPGFSANLCLSPAVQLLEPQVSYAAAVAWLIVERVQPIEMVDRETRNGFGRRKSKIHSHAPASIFLEA